MRRLRDPKQPFKWRTVAIRRLGSAASDVGLHIHHLAQTRVRDPVRFRVRTRVWASVEEEYTIYLGL